MSNSHIDKLKSGVMGGEAKVEGGGGNEHHISPTFSAQQYVDHWHVWISENTCSKLLRQFFSFFQA